MTPEFYQDCDSINFQKSRNIRPEMFYNKEISQIS